MGCQKKEEAISKGNPYMVNCVHLEPISNSISTNCNIKFWDIMYEYTYVWIESSFYTLEAPCNESVFKVKYMNSLHDHNEPDYTFILKMNYIKRNDFFKPDTINVKLFSIEEDELTGGSIVGYPNADVTLIWDEVSLTGNTYSGKGKIVIHKDIPYYYPAYKYPAQEIPFEF